MSDREVMKLALEATQTALNEAYHRGGLECCGFGRNNECCGDAVPTWTAEDQSLMNLLGPVEQFLRTALAAPPDAEVEALRRDAERYRYLRNRIPGDVLMDVGPSAGCWIDCEDKNETLQLLTGDDADAAIDAAMQEQPR